jgi:UDP-glucose 4-epimerase
MSNTVKCLVTGCVGFIGSHLTERLLREGFEVTGIDCFMDYYPREIKEKNIENALREDRFTFIEEDILSLEEFPDVDYVFHEAAQAGVRKSWGEDFEIYTRNNILATQKLLEYYKHKRIRNFIFASSSSVYGDVELPMRENSLLKPVSPYGVTKLAAENLCYLYWQNYGVPIISLRYFTVYGPRQRPDMAFNRFIRAIFKGDEIVIYGDGEQTRDFTYISDVVDANIRAMNCNAGGDVFNIGGGSRITVNDAIRIIEEITGEPAKVKYIEKQKGDANHTLADITKAQRILNYKTKVGIMEGLKKECEWIIDSLKQSGDK